MVRQRTMEAVDSVSPVKDRAAHAQKQGRSRSPPCSTKQTKQLSDSMFHVGETRLLGIIGGIFPPSTVEYYEAVNAIVRRRLGGTHNCNVLIWSLDQHPMVQWSKEGDEGWESIAQRLVLAASGLERAGATCIAIACNSVHKVYEKVADRVGIPILHIADATGIAIKNAGLTTVGLLGTLHTTESDWFIKRLKNAGIQAIVADTADRELLNHIIYQELNDGVVKEESRKAMRRMVLEMKAEGAGGVILGCTELQLLVDKDASGDPLPMEDVILFDTAKNHCEAAVDFVTAQS